MELKPCPFCGVSKDAMPPNKSFVSVHAAQSAARKVIVWGGRA